MPGKCHETYLGRSFWLVRLTSQFSTPRLFLVLGSQCSEGVCCRFVYVSIRQPEALFRLLAVLLCIVHFRAIVGPPTRHQLPYDAEVPIGVLRVQADFLLGKSRLMHRAPCQTSIGRPS